ncbi:MAG: Formimidoyltetrahydrofolate cyclodeaminase [Thermoleophilia bacterium]|nr:Formimidoyltetrahydrofolate cyclodeaminase [Thermoleophilia bacterium]
MAAPLLESVPNISVGRDLAIVDAIVADVLAGIERGADLDGSCATLADAHRDCDHDRSVLTLIGRGEALAAGLEALARACVSRIDLHAGHGVHPRVGVLDVLPVVALEEGDDVRRAAHDLVDRLGAFLGRELEVPAVRYALDRDGVPLTGAGHTGEVRRGGPATVAERVASGELVRIAGPDAPHPTAGITICGVREVLVAFNVDLDVDDLDAARTIAARIRGTADGDDALPGIRALGLRLASRNVTQVSTNIDRHRECGPARVLQTVARLAAELGGDGSDIGVSAAELVGLAPDSAIAALRYACTGLGVPLLASTNPSLDAGILTLPPHG